MDEINWKMTINEQHLSNESAEKYGVRLSYVREVNIYEDIILIYVLF